MQDDPDADPYSIDEPAGRPIDVGWVLKGQGWDDPDGHDVFQEVRIDGDPPAPEPATSSLTALCSCKPEHVQAAAEALRTFLRLRPAATPRSSSQIENFATLGGYAHGPWSRFIHVPASLQSERNGILSIVLVGCARMCNRVELLIRPTVEVIAQHVPESAVAGSIVVPAGADSTSDAESLVEQTTEEREDDEERRYDLRTFGELDEERPGDEDSAASSYDT